MIEPSTSVRHVLPSEFLLISKNNEPLVRYKAVELLPPWNITGHEYQQDCCAPQRNSTSCPLILDNGVIPFVNNLERKQIRNHMAKVFYMG